jgi:hypothetical protein
MAKKLVRNAADKRHLTDILTSLIDVAKKQVAEGKTNRGRAITQKDVQILNRARRVKKSLSEPPK